jgi:putative RNA 2'-phosphotransferase
MDGCTNPQDLQKLIPTILHALRHDPWKYGLDVDGAGWMAAEALLLSLRADRPAWNSLRREIFLRAVAAAGEDRIQLEGDRIRATYGHSLHLHQLPDVITPPDFLFHGTALASLPKILRRGLRPIGRQLVHLTAYRLYASQVAVTKLDGILLLIKASEAHLAGVRFHKANAHVWLTQRVPPAFIAVQDMSAIAAMG